MKLEFEKKREKRGKMSVARRTTCAVIAAALAAMLIPVGFWGAFAADDESASDTQTAIEQVADEQTDRQSADESTQASEATSENAGENADESAAATDTATKYVVEVKLEKGSLKDNQDGIKFKLERKSGSEWENAGEASLTEDKLKIDELESGTYRFVIDDEAESRELAQKFEIKKGDTTDKLKTEDGFELNENTANSLITLSFEDESKTTATQTDETSKKDKETNKETTKSNEKSEPIDAGEVSVDIDDLKASSNDGIIEQEEDLEQKIYTIDEVPEATGAASADEGHLFNISASGNGSVTVTTNAGTQTVAAGEDAQILVPDNEQAQIDANTSGLSMITAEVSYEPTTYVNEESYSFNVTSYANMDVSVSMGASFRNIKNAIFGVSNSDYSTSELTEEMQKLIRWGKKILSIDNNNDEDTAATLRKEWSTFDEKNPKVGQRYLCGKSNGNVGYVSRVKINDDTTLNYANFVLGKGLFEGTYRKTHCAIHGAAAPYKNLKIAMYVFEVTKVDTDTQKAYGKLYIYPKDYTIGNAGKVNLAGYQVLSPTAKISYDIPATGKIRIYKESSDDMADDDRFYSVEGAIYGLYTNASCTKAFAGGELGIKENGYSNWVRNLPNDKYWVKELEAPNFFQKDNTVYGPFTIKDSQLKITVNVKETPNYGKLKIIKSSNNRIITDGNSCYNLEGAEYTIYETRYNAINNIDAIQTLTTNVQGETEASKDIPGGTYWIKETKAPKGYELNEKPFSCEVVPAENGQKSTDTISRNLVQTEDTPLDDPIGVWINKVNAETGEAVADGKATFAGAQFRITYYDGQYGEDSNGDRAAFSSVTEQASSSMTKRSWVVQTDKDGYAKLSNDSTYFVSGDALYYDNHDNPTIPLGTITIEEIKAPEGFLINEQACYVRHITEEKILGTDDDDKMESYVIPICDETPIRNGISITKSLVGGKIGECEGIGFYLTNSADERVSWQDENGKTVDELYLNSDGFATTPKDALVYDTYTIHEDKDTVPDSIIWYGNAQGKSAEDDVVATVELKENFEDHAIYNVEVTNYEALKFNLVKVDGDSLRGNGKDEEKATRVEGSEWKLTFVSDAHGNEVNDVLLDATTDKDGNINFVDEQGNSLLNKFGTYKVEEVKPADGYLTCKDSWQASSITFTLDKDTYDKCKNGTYEGEAGNSLKYQMVEDVATFKFTKQNFKERTIKSEKYDEDDGSPVPNTQFQLYKYIGEGVPSEATDLDRGEKHGVYVTKPAEGIDLENWEVVAEGMTDSKGAFIFEGLSFGYYCLYENVPNKNYAEWWESKNSTWDRYYFTCDGKNPADQTQIFRNDKIEIGCDVEKSTIEVTSAAFNSLDGQKVNFQNVGKELYRYEVDFSSTSNVRADQYAVIDDMDFNEQGIRLDKLWLPTVKGDTDGTFNVWYKTNKTNDATVYDETSASSTNPENQMTDGTQRIKTTGWKMWKAGVDANARTQLSVDDLSLSKGEYITSIMLEFGSVEVGFKSDKPLTYMVYATKQLSKGTIIKNTAHSHITRNWVTNNGKESGLYDNDTDKVSTKVIDTFKYDSDTGRWYNENASVQTGDNIWLFVALGVVVVICGGALVISFMRRRKAE